jgi:aspartyl-tRNA(Asn)/glutamyl-tRNA(Gln) amidotransferase subunit C
LEDYGKIDRKLLEHVCAIARLNLTDSETALFSKELTEVLEAFAVLDKAEVDGEEPSFHPVPIKDKMRDDKVKGTKWEPLGNSKFKEGKYFKGPKII